MKTIQAISRLAERKTPWVVLLLSALGLQLTALYFQYGMDLQPCIMCIYQRTAVYGILLSALLVCLKNNLVTRLLGFTGWGISAGWGFLLAREHIDILYNNDAFFTTCEIVPNFPAFMPLHEWLPAIFAAPGDCTEDSWQFLSMGMAQWMAVIFAAYFVVLAVVLLCRLMDKKSF